MTNVLLLLVLIAVALLASSSYSSYSLKPALVCSSSKYVCAGRAQHALQSLHHLPDDEGPAVVVMELLVKGGEGGSQKVMAWSPEGLSHSPLDEGRH